VASHLDPRLTKAFRAVLEPTGTSLRWVIVRISLDLRKAWPTWKSRRVLGEINGFPFKTALIPAKPAGFTLIVNKKMQSGAKAHAGQRVSIRLSPDLGKLLIDMPAEFARLLKSDRALQKWFDALSPSMRKGFTAFISDAKTEPTRRKRAEAIAESLMLAMEGEKQPPPILRAAFQRQPEARIGWDSMTPTQRKHQLLGIFFSQTVNGRERRAAKTIESCLALPKKRRPQD
jgi:uncharacterized protein YdeI (YjbR/CyaY-like superfamily)